MGEKEKMEIEVVSDDSLGDVEVIKLIRDDGARLTFLIDVEKDPDEMMAMELHWRDGQVDMRLTDAGKIRAFFRTME